MTIAKDHSVYIAGGPVGVLLIHGLAGTPTEMRYVAQGVAAKGHTAYCPQLAGHCGTYDDLKRTTWQDWYGSAEVALTELGKRCSTVVVGGLSTGALLALLLAVRRPDAVRGTMLLAPTFRLDGWNIPWYARLFRLVVNKGLANLIPFPDMEPHGIKDEGIRAAVRSALCGPDSSVAGLPVTPGGAVLEHRWLAQTVTSELGNVRQPTLIIHPREDDYADLSNAWRTQRALKGMVEMLVLEDSYHIVTVDRQRDVVVHRVGMFLETLARQQSPAQRRSAVEEPAVRAG